MGCGLQMAGDLRLRTFCKRPRFVYEFMSKFMHLADLEGTIDQFKEQVQDIE